MSRENNGPVTNVYPCRGGARPGAGRPAGSKNQRSADTARQAAEAGITPIEVMLNAMRELWDQGSAEAKREAARIAKDAAPYVHPRLSNIVQTVNERPHYASMHQNLVARPRSGKRTLRRENTGLTPNGR